MEADAVRVGAAGRRRGLTGTTLLRLGLAGDGPSGWPISSMFNQPDLEALLDRRARQLPGVTVRRGVEVTGVEQGDQAVTVRTAAGAQVRAGTWWAATGPAAPSAP